MAIRPVDMQVLLPRALEAGRVNAQDGARAENQNNAFAQQFQKNVNQDGQRVVSTPETSEANVNKDGRSGDKYQRQNKKKKEDENKKAQNRPQNQGRGSSVDYKV